MARPAEHARAIAIAAAFGALFWVPAIGAAHGYFPAPLDDVYIHFDFARSLGEGHPFEWIPGQGYSSGETSPLYALILGIGFAVGFRGRALGVWAGVVAIMSVASLVRSTAELAGGRRRWLLAIVPLSIGIVDWSLFSGMEIATFAAALGRAVVVIQQLGDRRRRVTRESLEWRLGAWSAALVLLRPEAVVLAFVFAIAAARAVGRRSALAAMFRVSALAAMAVLAVLGANFLATGDFRSAGAQLKLLSSNPYLSDVDRARVFVENLVAFWVKVVLGELAVRPLLAIALPCLAALALLSRAHRRAAGACLAGALGWVLLVSWNGNAPYHNFRYYVPALVLLALAATLGLASIARGRFGVVAVVATVAMGGARIPDQIRHFRTASANIRDQQIEVGQRLARLPGGTRVLLGDAGAIPYVSGLGAVDALGLGGYRGVPFAHAAVHGEAATVELIERLDPAARPTHLALYANWFGALTSRFGVEIDRVTIDDNVICGSPTKIIYEANWSALGGAGPEGDVLDEIDVGDVISEEQHRYVAPLPHGGWTTLDVLTDRSGTRHFDGGRIIPDGTSESFVVRRGGDRVTLHVRIDGGARAISVATRQGDVELALEPPRDGRWRNGSAVVSIGTGEVVRLEARGPYRDYHVWITR